MEGNESGPPVVLAVEDDPDILETYRIWLEDEFGFRGARGGEEALEKLDDAVDVVLLDRMMPGTSGDDVLSEIKASDVDCQVAVVSALDVDFDVIGMGLDAYLEKPVDRDDVVGVVERLLERATYSDKLREYFALCEKRAMLRERKEPDQLDGNEAYAELTARIDELEADLNGADLDNQDMTAMLREIDPETTVVGFP